MTIIETIPLPETRIDNESSFSVRVTDLHAWPDQELIFAFEYNDLAERWIWECRHREMGRLWPRGIATLGYDYMAEPYIMAQFVDTTDRHTHVSSANLGEDVVLGVYPGPLGGSFHPDAEISEDEEDEFLGRHQWRPVR